MDVLGGDPGAGWIDLDGDGVQETWTSDANGDGVAETQLTDANFDGVADVQQYDTDGDGFANTRYVDVNYDGVVDQGLFDTDGDGAFDAQTVAQNAFAGGSSGGAGPFPDSGASGSTPQLDPQLATFLDALNAGQADAYTVVKGTIDPGSVSADELEAAQQRLHNSGQNTSFLEAQVAADEIRNDVARDTLERQWADQEREYAAQVEREAELAESRAEWAVWESQKERGV
ncbi:hypothetical protein AB0K60_10570 [Thermopolyspora sp. NPDC052614]|uniref:hypothetical protein n=1 Tax=Thermopolyspora sp. NPDC052614 TaxID=3155682 RepID=UPI003419C6C8